ncbi:hypothetical protein LSH36_31g07001 [Paralvinella palmiformis]|uniref:Uncharacterized protein n=1 Tax=Paralvinella palmiformis TaxID=53620 RepID=A0AAD9K9I7_9ANNE|nr:hypothetical protein LSH36_31g07001 [Paralvinella palmiformis]
MVKLVLVTYWRMRFTEDDDVQQQHQQLHHSQAVGAKTLQDLDRQGGKCSFVTVVHLAKAQIELCDLLQTDKYLTDTEQQYALFVLEPENIPSLFVFPRFTSCEIHPDSKDMMGGTFSAKTLGYHC